MQRPGAAHMCQMEHQTWAASAPVLAEDRPGEDTALSKWPGSSEVLAGPCGSRTGTRVGGLTCDPYSGPRQLLQKSAVRRP